MFGRDVRNCSGGSHVDQDNGSRIFFQCRHSIRYQISAQLIVDLHADVQACLDARSDNHRGFPQQSGQSLLHHKINGRYHTGKNGTGYVLQVKTIQRENIHQINADLICGFTTVCINRSQKMQFPLPAEKADGNVGIANVDCQQHGAPSLPFSFLS